MKSEKMYCKAYSALVILCFTCLLIFSKLGSDEGQSLFSFNLSYHLTKNGSSLIPDAQLPSVPYRRSGGKLSKVGTAEYYSESDSTEEQLRRMENNNSHIDIMDSPEHKAKIQESNGTMNGQNGNENEDVSDGRFTGHFNIKMLNEHLKRCIREKDNEVDMDEYIMIFQQLYKFFCMLGTVFGFIGSDVKTKIEILQAYREGENKTHYETVEKMVEFEKSTDYIHSNKESSGSRTFLRLHRSLIFVSKFLNKMETIGDQDGTSRICKEAYAQTLAKFHPWLIQKGAGFAMLGLPTKKDLIGKVCDNGHVENEEVIPIMHDVIRLTAEIYEQCDKIYTENDLHGLP